MATLAEAGSGAADVLRVQSYLLRAEDFGTWNALWAEISPPRDRADDDRDGFAVPGMLVEVEVTAGIPS